MKLTAYISILLFMGAVLIISSRLFSSQEVSKMPGKVDVVVIDAGHGGKDPGTMGTLKTHEKDINLAVALKLRDLLEQKYTDMKVVMTRDDDRFIELRDRGRIANRNGGNLFISIHCNAKKRDEENYRSGFELYILNVEKENDAAAITGNENIYFGTQGIAPGSSDFMMTSLVQNSFLKYSERIAKIIQSEMVKGTPLKSRGIFQEPFVVLYGASMPTILVECGYLSDVENENYLRSEGGQNEIANAIYKSVRLFKFDYDYENNIENQ